MKCPECEKEGKTSRVTVEQTTSTLMYGKPSYDEQGQYHPNDPNRKTTEYRCSNWHRFTRTSKGTDTGA